MHHLPKSETVTEDDGAVLLRFLDIVHNLRLEPEDPYHPTVGGSIAGPHRRAVVALYRYDVIGPGRGFHVEVSSRLGEDGWLLIVTHPYREAATRFEVAIDTVTGRWRVCCLHTVDLDDLTIRGALDMGGTNAIWRASDIAWRHAQLASKSAWMKSAS